MLRRLFGSTAPARHGPPESTALLALPLLLMDTETTGLDPTRDRLVSVAAFAWRGREAEPDMLDVLVNPGQPIPHSSTAIHGIADGDVADLPPYEEHHRDLGALLHGRIAFGHRIAFDLAILAAESRRARLHWTPPASLCLADLAATVLPEVLAGDLDALARHFDVTIEGRHSARGDALAVGAIWLRLLPLLAERGIRHWGEARSAAAAAHALTAMQRRRRW